MLCLICLYPASWKLEKPKFFLMILLLGDTENEKEKTPRQFTLLISLSSTTLQASGAGITVPILQTGKQRHREG